MVDEGRSDISRPRHIEGGRIKVGRAKRGSCGTLEEGFDDPFLAEPALPAFTVTDLPGCLVTKS